MNKKLYHQLKTTLEMYTVGIDAPTNTTQEAKQAKHRQNNSILKVISVVSLRGHLLAITNKKGQPFKHEFEAAVSGFYV